MQARDSRRRSQLIPVSVIAQVAVGVFIFGMAMLGMNYYYASKCLAFSPQEGSYAEVLEQRLLAAETAVHRNSFMVERLVKELEKRLDNEEKELVAKLMQHSHKKAAELTSELAKLPAPPLPDLTWSVEYEDPTKMEEFLDDAFGYAAYDDQRIQADNGNNQRLVDQWELGQRAPRGEREQGDDDLFGGYQDAYVDDDAAGAPGVGDGNETPGVQCREWAKKYGVIPGSFWGQMPAELQIKWATKNCDAYVSR